MLWKNMFPFPIFFVNIVKVFIKVFIYLFTSNGKSINQLFPKEC